MTEVVYAKEEFIPSFYECLKQVAQERIFLEMIDAPPIDKVTERQMDLIQKQGPVYYAINESKVIGWCDIFPYNSPRLCHRGGLGMGLLRPFRGQGLGFKLLQETLVQAKRFGLEKVELSVYTTNTSAIALYEKCGFVLEGVIKKYRKLDGEYFDCLSMARFL